MSNSIDGCNDNDDIMNVFRDKYMSFYNYVPYDECEMSKIKSIIETRIDTCNINYNISINDVIDAVMHLKTALSKNMPLIVNLEKRFKKFIVKNLSCSNPLVSIISKIALSNPMSDTGCNYRNLLDCNSELNINQSLVKWNRKQQNYTTRLLLYMS